MNELLTYRFEKRLGEILGRGMKVDVAPFLFKAEKKVDIARELIDSPWFIHHVISHNFWSILHPTGLPIHLLSSFTLNTQKL